MLPDSMTMSTKLLSPFSYMYLMRSFMVLYWCSSTPFASSNCTLAVSISDSLTVICVSSWDSSSDNADRLPSSFFT